MFMVSGLTLFCTPGICIASCPFPLLHPYQPLLWHSDLSQGLPQLPCSSLWKHGPSWCHCYFFFAWETLTILGKWIELLFQWKQLSSSMHFICGSWQVHWHYAGDSVGNPCLFSVFLAPTRISRVLLNESWSTPWNFQIDTYPLHGNRH